MGKRKVLNAQVVELVDTLDLESSAEGCEGSIPSLRTTLYASVTQLDRVSDYESEGRRFESYSTYHFRKGGRAVEGACLLSGYAR